MTLKILHYVDENNLVWARPWLQLIKYLEDSGLRNHIMCRPGGSLDTLISENNIGLSTYKPLISSLPQLCLGVSSSIKKVNPDLIHTRLSSAALIGGYWGKHMGVPVVSTIDKYPKRKYYLDSDMLIPCSSAVASHMKSLGFSDSAMRLIYNPVNMDEYQKDISQREDFRRKHDVDKDDFIILGAGRFVDWKGFDSLIRACAKLREMNQLQENWKLWLVGDGPEMPRYKKYVSDFALNEKTTFWGFQSDIKQFLWAADIFVQPSREPEGFSLMLLEAMAAGLPAAATAIGGTLDIIDDDRSGWLFQPDDVQKLTLILRRVLLETSLDRYSVNAQKKAENFSVEKIGDQTIRFYENVIREHQSRR
jgi:glycosyltransferase involved in cell wall biosynthesis